MIPVGSDIDFMVIVISTDVQIPYRKHDIPCFSTLSLLLDVPSDLSKLFSPALELGLHLILWVLEPSGLCMGVEKIDVSVSK
jgi:hypothetical protein